MSSNKLSLWQRARMAVKLAGSMSEEEAGFLSKVVPGGYKTAPYRGVPAMLKAYSRSPWVRAVVGKVGDAVGSGKWMLFGLKNSGGKYVKSPTLQAAGIDTKALALGNVDVEGELVPIIDHPALRLLNSANPLFPGNVGRSQTQISLDLTGEAFWLLDPEYEGGSTVPERFWLLPSHWVQAMPTSGDATWKIKTPAWEGELPFYAMFRFVTPDPLNPYGRGSGHLRAFGDEIDTDQFAAQYTKNWFLNSARPDLLITADDLGRKDTDRMEVSWLQTLQGFRRAHKPFFLPKKVDVHQLSPKFSDMEMRPLRSWERDVIVHGLGVPPEVLGIIENSNRATIEAADYLMGRYVVTPRLELQRTFLQYLLLPIYDDRLILAYANPVQEDREHQLAVMTANPSVFSVGHWKVQAGVEPDEGDGTKYLLPFNVKVVEGLEPTPTQEPLKVLPLPPSKADAELQELRAWTVEQLTAGREVCTCDCGDGPPHTLHPLPADTAQAMARELTKQVGGEGTMDEALKLSDDMQVEIVRAFKALRNEVDMAALLQAFEAGNIEAAMNLIDEATVSGALEDARQVLRQAVVVAGEAAAVELSNYLGTALAFSLTNPESVAMLEEFGADMVTNVSKETRDAIRRILQESYAEGLTPQEAAKRIRETVDGFGLTTRDMEQRRKLIDTMLEAGASQAEVDAYIEKWTEAKLRYRAQLIANNELVEAGNAGQEMLWDQAAREGLIDPNEVSRRWSVAADDRLCELCAPMAGVETGLYEPWETPVGPVNTPNQIHVRCRCSEVLIVKR